MSLLFIDSFDHYTTAQLGRKWTSSVAANIVSGGRNGTQGVTPVNLRKTLLTGNHTLIVGFAFIQAAHSIAPNASLFVFQDIGTTLATLWINPDFTISMRNSANTTIGTAPDPLSEGVYTHIQVKMTFTDTGPGGAYEVRRDGTSVLSGNILSPAGHTTANSVLLGYQPGQSLAPIFDDFYLANDQGSTNNDFLGDVMANILHPNAAGDITQWTPTGIAGNWTTVDDLVCDDDSTFVATSTAGNQDLYNLEPVPGSPPSIKGIQWNAQVRKTDASSYVLHRLIKSGGVLSVGVPSLTPNTTYANYAEVIEQDPATSAAWTQSGLNALQAGIKLVSVV